MNYLPYALARLFREDWRCSKCQGKLHPIRAVNKARHHLLHGLKEVMDYPRYETCITSVEKLQVPRVTRLSFDLLRLSGDEKPF